MDRLSDLDRCRPDGVPAICHGDFHPDNLLLARPDPVDPVTDAGLKTEDLANLWIIDWVDATLGDPACDVARTLLLITTGGLPSHHGGGSAKMEGGREAIARVYLDRYSEIRPLDICALEAWLPIVAAARLAEGISKETEIAVLLALVRAEEETVVNRWRS